jgi:hypothetical protein
MLQIQDMLKNHDENRLEHVCVFYFYNCVIAKDRSADQKSRLAKLLCYRIYDSLGTTLKREMLRSRSNTLLT